MDRGSESYKRYLAGDDSAMLDIVKLYRAGLRSYICGIVHDIYIADDITQETFVRLCLRKPADKGTGAFKTWLYTMGRHLAIDYLRKTVKTSDISTDDIFELKDPALTPEEAFLLNEDKRKLLMAMKKLSPGHRQILYLTYYEGFSTEQTAKIMKMSRHNTSAMLYRAKTALREIFVKEDYI